MKKNYLIIFLITTCLIFLTTSLFGQFYIPEGYVWFRGQLLSGDNASALYYKSNDRENAQLIFQAKDSDTYGAVRGSDDGKFGLADTSGDWFVEHKNQNFTKFYVGNEEKMTIQQSGKIGIGTNDPKYKLDVCGSIRVKEVIVEDDWCDYVFDKDYPLSTLQEEKKNIEKNGHLLGFESEETMHGKISLLDVTKRQQVKIEEYALHLIQLNEKVMTLEKQNLDLAEKYNKLEALLLKLQNQQN